MKIYKSIIYVLILSVMMIACDGTSTDEYLNGDFIDVNDDTTPPNAILPVVGEKVMNSSVFLQWTPKKGASSYTVEVTRNIDNDFRTQIPGSPFTVSAPDTVLSLGLPVQSSTYIWRVRANITAAGQYGQSSFEAMDDTVYVYCPADVAEPDNTGMAGNISKPYQTIMKALTVAENLNLSQVKVASRQYVPGMYSTYDEIIVLKDGIDLLGAYTPDFIEANRGLDSNRTNLRGSSGFTVGAMVIVMPTVFEGFSVQSSLDANYTKSLYIRDCPAETLKIRFNTIITSYMQSPVSYAVYLEDSGATIENNTIIPGIVNESYGIYIDGGRPYITGNTIQTSDFAISSCIYYGIYNNGLPVIRDNYINIDDSILHDMSFGIYNTSEGWISENTITGAEFGIYNVAASSPYVVNNLIVSSTLPTYSIGVFNEVGSSAGLYNNTLIGGATGGSCGMMNLSTSITMVNNILVTLDDTGAGYGYYGDSCTHSYNCFYAVSGQAYDPSDFTLDPITEIVADPQFDGEYKLTLATDNKIKFQGDNLYSFFDDLAEENIAPYDAVRIDRDGNFRSTSDGWSMGAYEYIE